MSNTQKELWFVTGSQDLYGEETLKQVARQSVEIVSAINAQQIVPFNIVWKPTVLSTEKVYNTMLQANAEASCIGVIVWMHTFSPSKMWIGGLNILQKPLCHFHTQYNRDIPFAAIDMDYMNLNQSAHGDREFGFMATRMRLNRKTIVGHWQNKPTITEIANWSRVAYARAEMNGMKVVRFGDNMRYVAVTEGDKVAAEMKLGIQVNTHGVGDLVKVINEVSDKAIQELIQEYEQSYILMPSLLKGGAKRSSLEDAAKIELGIKHFLEQGGYSAYTNTFEDLHGMKQLPGIGSQRMMAAGYGYGGEGDWKTSAMVATMKKMAVGLPGGNSFMEDYTYHFNPEKSMVLGSHMLEICPSIAESTVNAEIHPLGIGGKEDPVRLVFNVSEGPALNISLVDMGNRFRLIVNKVQAHKVTQEFPKLPTARGLWTPEPSMELGLKAWLMAGGAHHTVYSQNLSIEQMEDFADMCGIECIVIDENTSIKQLKNELLWNEVAFNSRKA
jgi:L-arabinose isomerase